MKTRNHTLHNLIQNRWFRLCFALVLAFGLLLIPIIVQTVIRLPAPSLPHSESSAETILFESNDTIELPLRLGATLVHATGGLTITKSAPATVEPGGTITYTLTITNDTGGPIVGGIVADPLPNDVTCGQSIQRPTNWTYNCSGGTAWTFSSALGSQSIADGATVQLIYTVNAIQPLTGGHKIVNDSYVITNTTPSFFDAGPAVTTTVQAPAWSITKTVSSDTIQPGQTLVYTIMATNTGSAATSGSYTISDTIPSNTTFASASTDGLISTSPPTWSFTDALPVSSSKSVTYSVTVNSPLADGTSIVNDGYTVSGGNAVASAVNNAITVMVDAPVSLSIAKTASSNPIGIGQVLTYTLTVTNTASTAQADNVVISDTLSTYVTYLSAGFVGGASGTITDTGGNPIIWTLANPIPANGSVQVTVTVQISNTLPNPPTITNNFQAVASNSLLVSGSMDVDGEAGAVDSVSLSLNPSTINNLCETTVATAIVRDAFGNLVSGVSVDIGKLGGTGAISPTLATGFTNVSGVFTATFRGVQATTTPLLNMIALASGKGDSQFLTINTGTPLPDNLSVTASPTLLSAGGATGVVTATLTDCQTPRQPVSGKAINLTLSNAALATFPGSSATANGVTNASGVVTATLTSTSTTTANGTVTITGTSSGVQLDTATVIIQPVNAPALQITKSAAPTNGSTVQPDDTIVYDLVLSNDFGTAAATGIVVTDTLYPDVDFVGGAVIPGGAGSGPINSGGVINFSVPNLNVGATVTARITVSVKTTAISGTSITNSATASDQVGMAGPSNIVSHQVISSTSTNNNVYLPILLKN